MPISATAYAYRQTHKAIQCHPGLISHFSNRVLCTLTHESKDSSLPFGPGDIPDTGSPAFHRDQSLSTDRDSLTFSVAILRSSANATPEFEGRGGDDLGTEIANTLYRIFNNKSSVDLRSLCISPREHCWVLYVDVLVSHFAMSLSHYLC